MDGPRLQGFSCRRWRMGGARHVSLGPRAGAGHGPLGAQIFAGLEVDMLEIFLGASARAMPAFFCRSTARHTSCSSREYPSSPGGRDWLCISGIAWNTATPT